MAQPVEPLHHGTKNSEKVPSILIVQKDLIPGIAARGDMIDCIWIFDS